MCCLATLRRLRLVGLEAYLQHTIAKRVAVQRLNSDHGLIVVGHRHETKAFALVRLWIARHLK